MEKVRLILMIVGATFCFSLQSQVEEASKALEHYKQKFADCLKEQAGECEAMQANIFRLLQDVTKDTVAARLATEFAEIREVAGYWDANTEAFLAFAHARNTAAGLPCEQVQSQFLLTRYALFTAEPQLTLERAEEGLALAQTCGEEGHIAHAYAYMGAAQIELGTYRSALENLLIAEEGYTKLKDQKGLAVVKLDMAVAYADLDERTKSRQLTQEAAMIYKEAGEELRYAIALIDLCSDYLDVGLTDSVQKYLPEAAALVEGRHPLAMAYVQQHYGNLYKQLGQYSQAIAALEKANLLNETIGDQGLKVNTYVFLAEVYTQLGNNNKAHQYAQGAVTMSQELGLNNLRVKTLKTLAETAYRVGAYEESKLAYENYIHWNDSLLGIEKQKEIAALEQTFAAEKREAEIERQQQENRLLSEKNKALNTRNLALLVALLLVGVTAYAFINRQRVRTEQQRTLVQLQAAENDRLQLEVHFKNRELTAQALHIAQKNEILNDLKVDLDKLQDAKNTSPSLHKLSSKLRFEIQIDDNWEQFTRQFAEMNPAFYQILGERHSGLTQNDLRLATLLRMNLGSKEIAHTLNISDDAVKKARYRLRKKLELETSDKLEMYLMSI